MKLIRKIGKYIRKVISVRIAPYMALNCVRIFLYRLCGYKIGKHVFIGMRCYLDDMEPKMLTIEDNVTISYGVFMACHGAKQHHYPITIKNNAYIGVRTTIITKKASGGGNLNGITIGKNAIIGACTLVNKDIPDGATAVGVPCRIIK